MTISTWEELGDLKRRSILEAIPAKWRFQQPIPPAEELRDVTGSYIQQFLTAREIEITETDAAGIAEQTTSGNWTAVEVTEAFCHRAALAHQLVSCLHEVFFDAAIEDAKRLDAYFAEHKKPVGPLHGLPVSLKDQFHVKGVETMMGYVGWIGTFEGKKGDLRRATFESELVKELRNLGAVLYCKTSVPASLMSGETVNNIISYTWNPKNRLLSSGGSSGGEGALIALRGSPGGFGTDIGGSIRVPSVFNGVFGIRPSSGRMPYEGAANSMDGQNMILSVVGPLATTARSLTLLFKAVLSQQPWYHDPLVLELPWRVDIEEKTRALIEQSARGSPSLSFAIMRHDGLALPHPPIARAVEIVEQTLKRLGHKVIEWKPPSHQIGTDIAMKVFHADGGVDVMHDFGLSGEPKAPQCIVKEGPTQNAVEIAALNVAKRQYQKLYMDYWNSTAEITGTGRPVDGVISPCAPHVAVIPQKYSSVGYTTIINVLDYTSVAFPVTHADKTVDVPQPRAEFLSDMDKLNHEQYDPEAYDGAPAGLQIFGRRLEEEKMLTLAEYISQEGSAGAEDNTPGAGKNAAVKDRKCQYCHQAFTSSSLGRHLDQFLFKKKPDGVHDVEEIRRIRSGITRRQARTSSGKRDTPERTTGKGQLDSYHTGESGTKSRDGVRMMFNTPTWHATGVINDIPNPSQSHDGPGASRFPSSQSRVPKPLPDYASRGASANSPDTMRALELALREVLDNIKAATSRMRPRMSPFDFDIQSQTFPSLCLQLLPPPPSLFAASPFPSPSSFPLQPPGVEHVEIVRQALRAQIDQWQSDQLSTDSINNSQPGRPSIGLDATMIARSAQQHEDISLRHLELAFKHWASLPPETRRDAWQLEITRAFAREMEKRKSLDDQLARVQQEANQLRAQVERLGSCQWPREFALFPPDTLPLPRDVARELDTNESKISPDSSRWDYDNVVAKWKRVVMHDKSMGRVGVGRSSPVLDDNGSADSKRGSDEPVNLSRPRILQPPAALSPSAPSPIQTGEPSASSSQQTSPYLPHDATRSPNAGPQAKRPRLMNGHHSATAAEGANSPSTNQNPPGNSKPWHPQQSLTVSNLTGPSGPTPPPSSSGT
ncbi:amidase signature domain-containing protein [Aspergillus alliaceus]|uniref:amidase n=1 Tax=Petromyces alliaceus TaxID=209559 RepID=A0A5N7CE57_PETAA|nr:amidase signature domain-containing protein [Aspergillus alliaceus]